MVCRCANVGKYDLAIREFDLALAIDPHHKNALEYHRQCSQRVRSRKCAPQCVNAV